MYVCVAHCECILSLTVTVNVGRAGAASLDVIQEVEYVKQEAKVVYLLECLQKTPPPVRYSASVCLSIGLRALLCLGALACASEIYRWVVCLSVYLSLCILVVRICCTLSYCTCTCKHKL